MVLLANAIGFALERTFTPYLVVVLAILWSSLMSFGLLLGSVFGSTRRSPAAEGPGVAAPSPAAERSTR